MLLYELMVAPTPELWRFLAILPKPQIACTISQQQQQMSQGKFICSGLDFEQKIATVQYYMAKGNGYEMASSEAMHRQQAYSTLDIFVQFGLVSGFSKKIRLIQYQAIYA
jgi:anthranilate/para-aminobenzoate synthase component I